MADYAGTNVGGNFYANLGSSDSAFPSAPPVNPTVSIVPNPTVQPPTNNSGIVSTTGVGNQYNDYTNQLQNLSSGSDQYAQMFQQQYAAEQARNALVEQQAISSASAKTANLENINNAQQAATLYGIRAQGAASGQSRYMPAATSLQTAGAQASFQYKYNQLDQQEKLAIAAAHAARSSGDVKAMGEMLNYIKQAQAMKMQLAQYQLEQQKFGFQQYQYAHPSAYQGAELGLSTQRLGISEAQLGLSMGINAPKSISTSPFYGFINNIFGSHLGTVSQKFPSSGPVTSSPNTGIVNGHTYVLGSDGNYHLQ